MLRRSILTCTEEEQTFCFSGLYVEIIDGVTEESILPHCLVAKKFWPSVFHIIFEVWCFLLQAYAKILEVALSLFLMVTGSSFLDFFHSLNS